MKNHKLIILLFIFLGLISCKRDHFIPDPGYRETVEDRFEITKKLAKNRSDQLFGVFDQGLKLREEEALKFLYAFMPLSDLADYDGEFFLKNIRSSFAARDTFSWGKRVPDEIFRHFVIPIRVNNENLDSSRWVFFGEIKERIKKMTMKDAALEVNHWCHEKVTYKGSDSRTSSPLASVKTAFGRCGEESTLTVAALRSVCIPARQCYTPRWAHSDDNHAWVEVWIDGKWHYMGACEPEPELDMAWFTAPARRAMLVNTNVFGEYKGSEDILLKDPRFTRINVLSNYTSTKRIYALITDTAGKPADSAAVEFQLYNYAEFYPLTRAYTGKNGICSFLTGYGDLLVWAAKGNHFGYQKVTVRTTDTVKIVLAHQPGGEYTLNFDFVPPPEIKTENDVSDSLKKRNAERVAFEDEIRANYEATFIDSVKTYRLAKTLDINPDTLWMVLKKSRGNWRGILEFITDVPPAGKPWIFPLLLNISEKDLRDVNPDVLTDNIDAVSSYRGSITDKDLFSKYILSPRIDNEFLKPFKGYFSGKFSRSFADSSRADPETLVKWVKGNVVIDLNANWGRAPITPAGVFELRVSDPHSRDIFFVAMCRSCGICSRLEPASRVPQYFKDGKWIDVWFEPAPGRRPGRGTLVLENDPQNERKPEYYIHFTVEKFVDGFYRSLDYEYDPVMASFPCKVEVEPGSCMMVTGNRIAGGTVLAKLSFFQIGMDKSTTEMISLRKDPAPATVFGTIRVADFLIKGNLRAKINPEKGFIISWLDPLKEPSRHFIADMAVMKADFTAWKGNIILFFKNEKELEEFESKNGKELPAYVQYLVSDPKLLDNFCSSLANPPGKELPLIFYVNRNSGITYFSEGYRIGSGDGLLKAVVADLRK